MNSTYYLQVGEAADAINRLSNYTPEQLLSVTISLIAVFIVLLLAIWFKTNLSYQKMVSDNEKRLEKYEAAYFLANEKIDKLRDRLDELEEENNSLNETNLNLMLEKREIEKGAEEIRVKYEEELRKNKDLRDKLEKLNKRIEQLERLVTGENKSV